MKITDLSTVKQAIFNRPDDANKGTCGSLLSICGCYGMVGAAMLAGKAALRCGIGLLKSAVPKSIYPIMASAVPESVFYPLKETCNGKISSDNTDYLIEQANKSSAVLVGCGLSVCDDTKSIVADLITQCNSPLVLDADALNCIADNVKILSFAKKTPIITPHPGEMSRLCGMSIEEINANRTETALNFAERHGVVCILKGKNTVIAAPDGKYLINPTGNSGMATGGSGDVLAGMTGALLAQGATPFYSAAAAVYLHGLSGDIAARALGKISMLPTDIIDCIPKAFIYCGFSC